MARNLLTIITEQELEKACQVYYEAIRKQGLVYEAVRAAIEAVLKERHK